jgi:hypothetical protein
MQRYKNYNRQIWIVLRSISTVALTLGLLGIAGCGWLFSQPESPLSEEEAQAILSILDEGTRLYRQLTEQGNPDAAAVVAERMRNAPEVAEAFVEEDGSVFIVYKCGLVGLILSDEHGAQLAEGLQPFRTKKDQSNPANGSAPSSYVPSSLNKLNSPQSRKAVIFAFKEQYYQTMAGEEVKKSLESMGYNVEVWCGGEFTLKRLDQLDQYGVIIFITHGGASSFGVLRENVWLLTGERADLSTLRFYAAIFQKGFGISSVHDEEGFYFIFDQNFILNKKLRFPNSLVLAMACHSFKWESMADAFLHKGAAVYFGWTDTTNEVFVDNFLSMFFNYGNRWPLGWSVAKVMSYQLEWPYPGSPKASLQEVFGNPEAPPKTVSCYPCIGCPRKFVEISLPAIGYVESQVPSTCFLRHEATPLLKWKGAVDLVLNPLPSAYFWEGFERKTLSNEWFWVREDPNAWSLSARPGYLRIYTQYGTIDTVHIAKNILLREAPPPPFSVVTRLEFNPTDNWHEACLLIYNDDDNYIKISRMYWSGNVYILFWEKDGKKITGFSIPGSQTVIEMQLVVHETYITGFFKNEAGDWIQVGQIQLGEPIRYKYVGLTAHNGVSGAGSIPADFDFIFAVPVEE